MTQKGAHIRRTEELSALEEIPSELAEVSRQRMDELADSQAGLLKSLEQANRHWLERARTEASLASEFAARLTAARSASDAMTIYQEWTSRRFELMAEDGKHMLEETQRLMTASARLWSQGWWPTRSVGGAGR